MRRLLRRLLIASAIVILCLAATVAYFLYAPEPAIPSLSAALQRDSLRIGTLQRHFAFYVPSKVAPNPPLLIALHGSMGNATQMRRASAYRFEQLADRHGLIVVYPEGYEGHWNDCRTVGAFAANRLGIDDVGFMRALVAHFRAAHSIDSARVFAAGISNGAHMAYRLAVETPDLVRGVAAVAANLPDAPNSECVPAARTTSVMIINGTDDPINPYDGGRVTLFGFGDRGTVLSARETAAYFATRIGFAGEPIVERVPQERASDTFAERAEWRSSGEQVVLYSIHGGGHVLPHPDARPRRLLGKAHRELDAPAEIWRFFSQLAATNP